MMKPEDAAKKLSFHLMPVSYTHLDVYKRQALKTHIAGAGRRVRAMVDKVKYDTEAASALANNFYADGVNEYTDGKAMELYVCLLYTSRCV